MNCFIFFLLFGIGSATWAQMPKGDENIGARLPGIQWTDGLGRSQSFDSLKGLPVVLVPFYSNCHSSCPITIRNLLQSLAGLSVDNRKFQILLFSMDPKETIESLRQFRESNHLPLNWMVGLAAPEQSQVLWDALGFRFISSDQDFVHPDWVVFLTPDLHISSILPANRIDVDEVKSRLSIAEKDKTFQAQAGPWLLSFSILGLLFSTVGAVHFFSLRRTAAS